MPDPFQLGAFLVAPELGTISSPAGTTRVEPKVMEVLLALVQRAGRLAAKDEILDAVWRDTAVVEGVLTRCVYLLRAALGDDRSAPRYIETIPRRGYRLVAPVQSLPGPRASRALGVAVLPFHVHGAVAPPATAAAGELLAAGLARHPAVRVVSRTTLAGPGGGGAGLPGVARSLGVEWVVEGTVLCGSDGSQRVTARLFDGAADRSVWSGECRVGPGGDVRALDGAVQHLACALAQVLSPAAVPGHACHL
jgi:DNA-binding winged helix-turn-helix (wHTH) protein